MAYGKIKVDQIESATKTVDVDDLSTSASPTFTGTVTIPTPTAGDSSTKAASTAFVDTSFSKKASPTFTGTVTAAIGVFTGDVTFDSATNAGQDVVWDESDSALEFADSTKAVFGTGGDLSLVHDGTNSTIENVTGELRLDPKSGERGLVLAADGAVTAYYDNAAKIATSTGGVNVTGTATVDGITIDGKYEQAAETVAALNIDCATGNYFKKVINSASQTFTVSNIPASGTAYTFILELELTSGSVNWFSNVEWPAATAPTLTTGKTHLIIFNSTYNNAGSHKWRASTLLDYTT